MDKETFKQHWLQDDTSFEAYEATDLKYAVWGFYKAQLSVDNCIEAFDNLIRKAGLFSFGKKEYIQNKQFLEQIKTMMNNPKISYRIISQLLKVRNGQDVVRLQHLIQDNDCQMIAGMLLSDEYAQVKGLEPEQLLAAYPYEQYLRETDQMDLLEQYEREHLGVSQEGIGRSMGR